MFVRIFTITEQFYLFIILWIIIFIGIKCKTFTTCELITELRKQSFLDNEMQDWLCLIEAESSRRSDVIGGPDKDGSYDYGLFQINSRYWCNADEVSSVLSIPRKGCNVRCKDLLSDDITLASECAKKIKKIQGFEAWNGWVENCKGKKTKLIDCPSPKTLL